MNDSIFNKIFNIILLLFTGFGSVNAQLSAFPGAEGWGKYTTGGRGGTVYEVTNLNNSGPGSLRDAVSQSNRIVVFRVSGDIELKSELVIRGNITIAGQTAPGDGICVRDYPTKISGNNVIIRYIRFRLGDRYGLTSSDALDVNDRTDIILDHCDMTWGVDECFSAYGNKNMTVQWCIIGEGLTYKGHSMGGLWGGYTSYHHNLLYANASRNPKYAYTYDEDITDSRNNVIYNWGYQSAYTSPTGRVNLVNNYYKAGPATGSSVNHRIVQAEPTKRMYIHGNYVAGFPVITADNWNGGVDPLNGGLPIRYDTPFPIPYSIPEQTAEDAYYEILKHVGVSFPGRDDVDQRVIKNLRDSTGTLLFRQDDLGGFPRLFSQQPPADTDHDGMPDDYETELGLKPDDPSDRNGDLNGNGYTNIEDYINGLIEIITEPARPGFFTAKAFADRKVNLSWCDYNQDELGFVIERSTDSIGFVIVDTVPSNTINYVDTSATPSTIMYYRIKTYNDTTESQYAYANGTETFADGAKPEKAEIVYPLNNQTGLPVNEVDLKWIPGNYTLTYDIYIGYSEDALELKETAYTSSSYKVDNLSLGTDIFWQIDAVNENGTTIGDVWKFTTAEAAVPELVGYWPFNEEEGIIVYDSTEYGNWGTLKNLNTLLRVEGKYAGAISFSNSQVKSHIEIPNQPQLNLDQTPFSIAFWMRLNNVSDASTYILHKGSFKAISGTGRTGKWFGLEMKDGEFRFSVDDNEVKTSASSSTSNFVTGDWVHVVIIRDVNMKQLRIYKNGSQIVNTTDNTTGIGSELPLIIGNSDFLNTDYYSGEPETPYFGELDELVITRHPLSPGEIDSLYRFNKIPALHVISPEGISEEVFISELKAYPNPFNDQLVIEFNNGVQNNVIIEIYDIQGRLLKELNKSVIPNTRNRIGWDGTDNLGSKLSNGMFCIILKDKNGTSTGRTVVIKN